MVERERDSVVERERECGGERECGILTEITLVYLAERLTRYLSLGTTITTT